jgi:hypothetical protein
MYRIALVALTCLGCWDFGSLKGRVTASSPDIQCSQTEYLTTKFLLNVSDYVPDLPSLLTEEGGVCGTLDASAHPREPGVYDARITCPTQVVLAPEECTFIFGEKYIDPPFKIRMN